MLAIHRTDVQRTRGSAGFRRLLLCGHHFEAEASAEVEAALAPELALPPWLRVRRRATLIIDSFPSSEFRYSAR